VFMDMLHKLIVDDEVVLTKVSGNQHVHIFPRMRTCTHTHTLKQ